MIAARELLPPRLPLRRDRLSIYDLYEQLDRLAQEFGWRRELLFQQQVKLPNHYYVNIPIFAYRTSEIGLADWLITGVHGHSEQAGPEAVAQSVPTIATIAKGHPMVVIGLLNANYITDRRFPNHPDGKRQSLGDFDHLVPDNRAQGKRPRKLIASNEYADTLGRQYLRLLGDYPGRIFIDLHEDFPWPYEKRHYGKPHIYSDGVFGYRDPVAREVVKIFHQNGTILRMNTHNHSDEITRGGISMMDNGSTENLFAAKFLYSPTTRELIPGPHVPVVITTETPTTIGSKTVPVGERVRTQSQIIAQIPEFRKIYRKNWKRYRLALAR